jgi:hypothetical protein
MTLVSRSKRLKIMSCFHSSFKKVSPCFEVTFSHVRVILAFLGIDNQINMYRNFENGNRRPVITIHRTTLHELAHASHWEFRKGDWDGGKTSDRQQESWAMGVAWSLNRLRYENDNANSSPTFVNMIDPDNGNNEYTSLIIDMIDQQNQGLIDINFPFDRVQGYTISQIEGQLEESADIADLRDNVFNGVVDNPTRGFLNELFNQYINFSR